MGIFFKMIRQSHTLDVRGGNFREQNFRNLMKFHSFAVMFANEYQKEGLMLAI